MRSERTSPGASAVRTTPLRSRARRPAVVLMNPCELSGHPRRRRSGRRSSRNLSRPSSRRGCAPRPAAPTPSSGTGRWLRLAPRPEGLRAPESATATSLRPSGPGRSGPAGRRGTKKSRPTPITRPLRRWFATTAVTGAPCSARSTSTPVHVARVAAWSRRERSRARPAAAAAARCIAAQRSSAATSSSPR